MGQNPPKKPNEAGWGKVVEAAQATDDAAEALVGSSEPFSTEVYQKGAIRVVSSYVNLPGHPPRWMVSASKNGLPPDDKVMKMVKKVFDMRDAKEVAETGRHRMLRSFDKSEAN